MVGKIFPHMEPDLTFRGNTYMALIVQKFGGSSVADANKIRNVARIITETYKQGNSVVAVLSAQGDTTDDLIAKAQEINPNASKREMDMLLSTGEQISISLCAMAIERMGIQAVSLTGWQAGVLTDSGWTTLVLQLQDFATNYSQYQQTAVSGATSLNESISMAGTMLSILPLLIMYFVLQRHFVESIDRTGITGE